MNRAIRTDQAQITARAVCKDDETKICAWTSARKTVLTRLPDRSAFLQPEYGARVMAAHWNRASKI
jgi:hypothetical protein